MSWQQPGGSFNPNANAYIPPSQGAYYPPQQGGAYNAQQGGFNPNQGGYAPPPQGGFYPPQQGGPYLPQQGGAYNRQHGGFNPNQGGYVPPSRGGQYPPQPMGAPYSQHGGYNASQQGGYGNNRGGAGGTNQHRDPKQDFSQPPPSRPVESASARVAPKASAADSAKLSLGGASHAPAPLPAKKKGGTLSLSKKKAEDPKSDTASSPVSAEEKKGDASKGPNTSAEAGKKGATKLSAEDLRENVRKEIAKQREQSKKEFKRDPRPHFNVVFCGHVDAGKSTISGHLLMEKGLVDEREMDKLRREAEILHREGWEYAYVMDVSEEERTKGITRETGAAYFETEKRRVTVLDAPGHKAFVPSMIGGATQADVCVLVISSRTGEFETGFEKGGQTREHALLVRTCGVKQMICVINKMDEMKWSRERYDEIVGRLKPFLRQNGYDTEKASNLVFLPVAGLTGENLIYKPKNDACPWYTGPTMMEIIDDLVLPESKSAEDVLCIPLVGAYKEEGKSYIYGKVESGSIAVGEKIQLLPPKQEAVVEGISIESTEFEKCYPGDNVHLRVRGIEENEVHAGYVATSVPTSMRAVEFIQARVVILDVKNIICAGSRFMLHVHAAQEEASFHKLLAKVDKKTGEVVERNPSCAKADDVVIARIELERPIVLDTHKDFDRLGRFVLRDDGKTIAIGLITKLYESTHESLAKTS